MIPQKGDSMNKRKFDLQPGDRIRTKRHHWTVTYVSDHVFGVERMTTTGIKKDCFQKKDYEYRLMEIEKVN